MPQAFPDTVEIRTEKEGVTYELDIENEDDEKSDRAVDLKPRGRAQVEVKEEAPDDPREGCRESSGKVMPPRCLHVVVGNKFISEKNGSEGEEEEHWPVKV